MTHAAKTIPTFPDLAGKVAVVTGSFARNRRRNCALPGGQSS